MMYHIRGENIDVTPALREYVEKKSANWSAILTAPMT
ncbi:hypothetical protein LR69_01597 [Geobacillus sp. BCO2]|nr:hypothetical protein LR69_01597 [Geobacillus sp. BCO2]